MTGIEEPRCLRAALDYARLGWQVLPLNWPVTSASGRVACSCRRGVDCASPGKHPWVKWKTDGGSTDSDQIRNWWERRRRSNVAILTGRNRSGLFVVDVDEDHGGADTLHHLQERHGELPVTLTATTGSGGSHLLFKHPETGGRQTAGGLGPGVDTRAEGGLIVAAPSLHRSGRRYTWDNGSTPIAELPEWIIVVLQPKPAATSAVRLPPRNTARGSRYAEVALDRACTTMRTAANGDRNATLNKVAYSMGRLVGGGLISAERAGYALAEAAVAAGLGQQEIDDTIVSGLGDGVKRPRQVPA